MNQWFVYIHISYILYTEIEFWGKIPDLVRFFSYRYFQQQLRNPKSLSSNFVGLGGPTLVQIDLDENLR